MPARRIGQAAISIALYDVLGFDSQQRPAFIRHVALSAAPASYLQSQSSRIRLTHIVPPLQVDMRGPRPHCHGDAGLTEAERRSIEAFVEQIRGEFDAEEERRKAVEHWSPEARYRFRADQYTILPHVRWADDERPYNQFSCAGFVQEAYAAADIDLVEVAVPPLPQCALDVLKIAYEDVSSHLDDAEFRADKGLVKDGPWPILLPGYVLNALNRTAEDIREHPYEPAAGDECFPPDRLEEDLGPFATSPESEV